MSAFSVFPPSVRSHFREPLFALLAVLTLALGIGTATAVYSLVYAVLLRPYPYADPAGLVRVESRYTLQGGALQGMSLEDIEDYRQLASSLVDLGAYEAFEIPLVGNGPNEVATVTQLNPAALAILGVAPHLGRLLVPEEDQPGGDVHKALIGYGLWRDRFGGDPAIVGKPLRTARVTYTIVGVMPAGFAFPQQSSIWTPMESYYAWLPPALAGKPRDTRPYATVARLEHGVTLTQAEAELNRIAERLERAYPKENAGVRVKLTPLREFETGQLRPYLFLLMAGVGLVLLTCCANVAGLMLVRTNRHRRDLAIQAALGAGRARIIRQHLGESVFLAVAGGVVGILLAHGAVRVILAMIPMRLPFWMDVKVDGSVVLVASVLTFLTGLLFGVVPAVYAVRTQASALRAGTRSTAAGGRTQSILVVGEVALSLLLLMCAALLMKTLIRLQDVDTGFERTRLVTARVLRSTTSIGPSTRQSAATLSLLHERILESLRALPGVTAVAVTNSLPFTGTQQERRQDTLVVRRRADTKIVAPLTGADVSADYFRAMEIPLRRGRLFNHFDTSESALVAIINERGARILFPEDDPLGQEVLWGVALDSNIYCRIVGVVADVRHQAAERDNGIELYFPMTQWPVPRGYYVLRVSGDSEAMAAMIRRTIEAAEPTMAIAEVKTMDRRIDESLWQRRLWGVLFTAFAFLSLLLAAVGLYAVMSHAVAQRTREIGIRLALGGRPLELGWIVIREGMALVAVGVVAGALAALMAGRAIATLLHDVPAHDPATFVIVTAVLTVSGLAAVILPAQRAARVDPIITLKQE